MNVLRWILLFPVSIIALMIGSLVGGVAVSLFGLLGQAFSDTGSAFAASFAFVLACCLLAPSHRPAIGVAAATIVAILALGTIILSNLTTIEEFAALSTRQRLVVPVAQALGALYALCIGLPALSDGATAEEFWREIRTLGLITFLLGALLSVIGICLGLAGFEWLTLKTGLGVILFGLITWILPLFLIAVRLNSVGNRTTNVVDS